MEAVLMQGIGRLDFGDTSKLDEPSSLLLFSSTCKASYLLHKGTLCSHRGECPAAPGRSLSPLPPFFFDGHFSGLQQEKLYQ